MKVYTRSRLSLALLALVALFLSSCTEEVEKTSDDGVFFDENYFLTSSDTAVTGRCLDLSYSYARLQGKLNVMPRNFRGCTFGVVISTNPEPDPEKDRVVMSKSTSLLFSVDVTGLALGTRYYYRSYFRYNSVVKLGRVMYFTTPMCTLANKEVTNVTPFSAKLHASCGIRLNDVRFTGEFGALVSSRQTDKPSPQVDKFVKGYVLPEDSTNYAVNLESLSPAHAYVYQPYVRIDTSFYWGPVGKFSTSQLEIIETDLPVDMGFTTFWAAHNVGASSSEAAGTYFAWADTTGEMTSNKVSDYPKLDEISGTEFDMAMANEGVGWQMPTFEQMQELVDNCIWSWTTHKGVQGYAVVSRVNGNTIFFPAAGYARPTGDGRQVEGADMASPIGFYWTGSLNASFPNYAYSLYIAKDKIDYRNQRNDRTYGYCVRAVLAY